MAVTAASDLDVHRCAHDMVLATYRLTKGFPKDELFGLASQLRRAAVSIPANISEGFAKRSKADKLRFYNIAQGSLEETKYYFRLAKDLGYGDTAELTRLAEQVGRMLGAYVRTIEKNRPFLPLLPLAPLLAVIGQLGTNLARRGLVLFLLLASCFLLPGGNSAFGAPSQEDVFRSIQDSVGGETESPDLLPYLAGVVGLLILIIVISQRRKRAVAPRSLNHQGKLLREIVKVVPIRAREMKQLKIVADNTDTDGPQPSPLTLLLCPSVMAKTIQNKRLKIDRRAMTSIARKAGLQVTKK